MDEGILRVRVAAPAVDGAANDALVRLIARELDVAPSRVQLVRGRRARQKVVTVGIEAERVRARWAAIVVEDGGSS